MKTVGYIRVSTPNQDTKKNRHAILEFANKKDFGKVSFVEEKVSGRVNWKERKIKGLIDSLNKGDHLIVPELSRLGRSTFEIMQMLQELKEKEIDVFDVKNGWELNGSIQSEVLAFAFSIAARIERDLLISRCAEGRERAKARGVRFGRPKGPGKSKLDPHKKDIIHLLSNGSSKHFVSRKYGCTCATVCNWLKKNNIKIRLNLQEG